MKKLNKKGFTLVELVIVIAVIAILAGVLIPTFSGVINKAHESSAVQNGKNFYTQLCLAAAEGGEYKVSNQDEYTYQITNKGLEIKQTTSGADLTNAKPIVVVKKALGEDGESFYGAKLSAGSIVFKTDASNSYKMIIDKFYFQPKGSTKVVEIDLVNGSVSIYTGVAIPANQWDELK